MNNKELSMINNDLKEYELKFNTCMNYFVNAKNETEAFQKFFKIFPSAQKITCECKSNNEKSILLDDNINYIVY